MATTSEMRAWAREQGITVGERGRLHPDVVKAYAAAHSGEELPTPPPTPDVAHDPAEDEEPKKKKERPYICGFCYVRCENQHVHCPGTIRNGSNAPRPILECACAKADHQVHLITAE